ncbi:hypothetical protein BGZ97_008648 [Linnemannia gamsii]|uniref:LptD C-terminal domain-containing protein n=1 Tax=Linnemannia gamsii TaxID=64522 RepID=A0A9P6RMX2_9FUNG|nr:hypothetical protein BGZ97_008648 [Linnemannia gamsii]
MAALLALPASMPLCAFSQPPGQHPLRAGHGAAKFVLGDQIEAQGEQQVTVSGAAEVRTPTLVIKGDRLHYDAATDQADAYGNVRIINKGNTFSGPEAHLKVKANEGYMLSPHYHFNAGGSGSAQRIDVLDPERTVITHGTYTGFMQSRRYAIYAQHRHQLKNGLGAYFNYNRVSDHTYPEDLTAGNIFMHGTQLLYQQEAGLTYNQGPWSALARVQRWQTLPPSAAPYGREPELNVKYERYDEYGFDFGAQANYSRFRIATADLTEDSGLVFERAVRFLGTEYIQTLEPRLYYVYTPYREQNFMPLFDTAEADFGLAEIYTENTFVGNDRVADASRLTAGITTRFTDPVTGDERGRIGGLIMASIAAA